MNAAPPSLKPLDLGELVDRSATFWRQHVRPLFLLQLAFQFPEYVFTKACVLVMYRYFPELAGRRSDLEALSHATPAQLWRVSTGLLFLLAAGALASFAFWYGQCATTYYVGEAVLGRPVDLGAALRKLRERLASATGSFVLVVVLFVLLWLLLVAVAMGVGVAGVLLSAGRTSLMLAVLIPLGLVLGLAGLSLVLVALMKIMLAPAALMLEGRPAWDGIRRGSRLVSGRIGAAFTDRLWIRAAIVLTAVGVLLTLLYTLAGAPALIVQILFGNLFTANADATQVPQLFLVPAELVEVAAKSVVTPLGTVVATLFYFDVRVRREGLDLELQLEKAA